MPGSSRIVWVLSILSLSLPAAELKIDHVTVCGQSLPPMEAKLERLGIHWEFGGPHANHATEMAIASFADGSYLELIAVQPDADPGAVAKHTWSKYMEEKAGPCAWAVRSSDVLAEANRLRATGLRVSALNKSGRTRPDGFRLDWETAQVGTEGNGVFFPFLIRDFTPREKRAFPSGKPGNPHLRGVTAVVIAVSDVNAAAARFRKAYDLPPPQRKDDRAVFPGTPVILQKLPRRVAEFGEGVTAFEVTGQGGKTIRIEH